MVRIFSGAGGIHPAHLVDSGAGPGSSRPRTESAVLPKEVWNSGAGHEYGFSIL